MHFDVLKFSDTVTHILQYQDFNFSSSCIFLFAVVIVLSCCRETFDGCTCNEAMKNPFRGTNLCGASEFEATISISCDLKSKLGLI